VLDGAYRLTDGVPVFQPIPAPTTDQLQALLTRIITRILKMLTRNGALTEEDTEIPDLTNPNADPALAPLHAAACTYRIALGPRAGKKGSHGKTRRCAWPVQRSRIPSGV